jgi:RNA polymerase sigma factor (sigma-70 family)
VCGQWDILDAGLKENQTVPESILRRIAGGERAAVRECISRYGGLIWSLAQRYCTETADVDDAVQEIFIDLWTHAGRFNPAVAPETTFVAMLARRTLIDRNRKRARQGKTVSIPGDLEARPGDGPVEQLARRDEVGRAARALERLSEKPAARLDLVDLPGIDL